MHDIGTAGRRDRIGSASPSLHYRKRSEWQLQRRRTRTQCKAADRQQARGRSGRRVWRLSFRPFKVRGPASRPLAKHSSSIAQRIIEDTERLGEQTKASGAGRVGRIVVGFYMSLSTGSLRAALHYFRKILSRDRYRTIRGAMRELAAAFMLARIDVAILLGDPGRCDIFNSLAMRSELLVVAVAEDHPLADPGHLSTGRN